MAHHSFAVQNRSQLCELVCIELRKLKPHCHGNGVQGAFKHSAVVFISDTVGHFPHFVEALLPLLSE
jgi:hypothetical protein